MKMTESKYKILQVNQDLHTDEEDDGDEDDEFKKHLDDNDDSVTIVHATDSDDHHYSRKFIDNNTMQTPAAILSLILIYFTLSIGLTFYQRNLLRVCKQ